MDQVIKDLWIKDLESGELRQGKNKLCSLNRDGSREFCCLGVLTDIAVRQGFIQEKEIYAFSESENIAGGKVVYFHRDNHEDYESSVLPSEVVHWAGLSEVNPDFKLEREQYLDFLLDNGMNEEEASEATDEYFTDLQYRIFSAAELNDDHGFTFPQIAKLVREQL